METEIKYGSLSKEEYEKMAKMLADIGIPKETLDLLIAEELRSQAKKIKEIPSISHQPPYYLKVLVHCKLCGTSFHRNFHMEERKDGLHSREVEFIPEDVEIRTQCQEVEHCDICEIILSQKTTATLVKLVMALVKQPKIIKLR